MLNFESVDQIHLINSLVKRIKSLSKRGKPVKRINQVVDPSLTLITLDDLNNNPKIKKDDVLRIRFFIENILVPQTTKDTKRVFEYPKVFSSFRETILNHLQNMDKAFSEITTFAGGVASPFLNTFAKGGLSDSNKFLEELEKVIATLVQNRSKPSDANFFINIREFISQELNKICEKFDYMASSLKKSIVSSPEKTSLIVRMPKSIQQLDQIVINQDQKISFVNGIDINLNLNVFIASGGGGDLVMKNLENSKEVWRVKVANNHQGKNSCCYLWSPYRSKIMIATATPSCIYILNEKGGIMKGMENVSSLYCWGAAWLSEKEVALGYEDGTLKWFNVVEGKELGRMKLNGQFVWGMEALDENHLISGDSQGNLYNIVWREKRFEWWKDNLHSKGKAMRVIKISSDKTKVLTGGDDFFMKCTRLSDLNLEWQFKFNNVCNGLAWGLGDRYVIGLSESNQLIILDAFNGKALLEYNKLSTYCMSMRFNEKSQEILVGDLQGSVRKLKIIT